ncbi:MAG TPA: VOC family protein [Egibacteraceae bacterium]|nr:VOC family protein [Egibacteraceae bacterium]
MAVAIQVTFDCADPAAQASFWAQALGYVVQPPPEGYESWEKFLGAIGVPENQWNSANAIVDPKGLGPRIYFQRVPEAKTAKNRVHLDVNAGGGHDVDDEERRQRVDDAAQRLVGLGATFVEERTERGERWIVMQDPEGNEFCLQ